MVTLNVSTTKRLDEICGPMLRRSPSVRVLAAFSQNTDCRLATLGFAAGVDFDRLLAGTRYRTPFGQSPFAIQRGLAFEKLLRNNDYALALDLLRGPLVLPATGVRVVNLRVGFPSGPDRCSWATSAASPPTLRRTCWRPARQMGNFRSPR